MYRQSLLAALLCFCVASTAGAEVQPSNSPERAQCNFQDHTDATIEYGKMHREGRKIFGGLVSYGKPWEMGSTRSPTLTTSANLLLGGKEVKAGRYSLIATPNPDKWTLVLKKMGGSESQNHTEEIAGIDLLVRSLHSSVEDFTISFDQYRAGCLLNLRWEQTEASVLLVENR